MTVQLDQSAVFIEFLSPRDSSNGWLTRRNLGRARVVLTLAEERGVAGFLRRRQGKSGGSRPKPSLTRRARGPFGYTLHLRKGGSTIHGHSTPQEGKLRAEHTFSYNAAHYTACLPFPASHPFKVYFRLCWIHPFENGYSESFLKKDSMRGRSETHFPHGGKLVDLFCSKCAAFFHVMGGKLVDLSRDWW